MSVYLYPVATQTPATAYPQDDIAERTKRLLGGGDRKTERIIHYLYSQSGIAKRHSVIEDFLPGHEGGLFFDPTSDSIRVPTTAERNRRYAEEATRLAPQLAQKAIERCPALVPSEITHVVTASCTGFFQPGIDFRIVRECGLSPNTPRFHLGFMGCYAAFPALKLAQTICQADARAVVLVECFELCSLHLQMDAAPDNLLGGSVFADGGGAAIVSARTDLGVPAFRLERFRSTLTPTGEDDMAWNIGDHGFVMRLSTYVPEILHGNIAEAIGPILTDAGLTPEEIRHWAVHPGGRAILDKVRSALDLCEESLAASRHVLREYGNMSSATIFFVLETLYDRRIVDSDEPLLALAFGPGLTVESAILRGV
ncbi:MAG: type III polyketide synthase [Capsulimonadales bacterium]|nr:type III polyketide synthase [Capsulimonadales bacterium]